MLYGVGALVGGPLGDRIGENKTIALCLMFSGLSTFIMFAASAMYSIYIYAVALILMAAWASLYHPTANSLISKTFKVRVAETMGLHGVGGTLGVVLTPYIAWLLGVNFGWSWSFVIFGLLCVLLALIFAKIFNKTENRAEQSGTIIDALKIRELWMLLFLKLP